MLSFQFVKELWDPISDLSMVSYQYLHLVDQVTCNIELVGVHMINYSRVWSKSDYVGTARLDLTGAKSI